MIAGGLALAGGSTSRARAAKGAVKLMTPRGKPTEGRWQSYADASRMPTIRGRVRLRVARCPALPFAAGCVYTKRPRTIFLRPGLSDPRGVLLHELGHTFDLTVMNNRDRGGFRKIMRGKKRRWWQGEIPLAEQFAEAYSWCARYARIVSIARYSSYHYRPRPWQHRQACRLIVAAVGDRKPSKPPAKQPVVTKPHAPPAAPPSSEPGVVPGDPERDPGPQPPEDPTEPLPAPTPRPPIRVPPTPVPQPTAVPTPTPIYGLPIPP